MAVRIFAPKGGEITGVEFNGVPSAVISAEDNGVPVAMTYVSLEPGQTVDLAWKMKSGEGQDGDTTVAVTPTIEKTNGMRTLESACAKGR